MQLQQLKFYSFDKNLYLVTYSNNSTFIIQNSTLPAKRDFLQAHHYC